jgi:hypothetical protein
MELAVTSAEIAWWTPLWKRLLLMAVYAAAIITAALTNGVMIVALFTFMAGVAGHQMFGAFPPRPTDGQSLSKA